MTRIVLPALCVLLLLMPACAGRVGRPPHRGYDTVVGPAPTRIEGHPFVIYEGGPVYFVEGRWYRRFGMEWSYYREEPPFLMARRPVTATTAGAPIANGP